MSRRLGIDTINLTKPLFTDIIILETLETKCERGGNYLKKMFAAKERLLYTIVVAILSVVLLVLIVNFYDNVIAVILSYIDIVFIVFALLKLFTFCCHILIIDDRMKIYDFPLLATNKYYVQKRGLILWNSEINIDEVENAELVALVKDNKIKYTGYAHQGNRYIKVNFYNSCQSKYIYGHL